MAIAAQRFKSIAADFNVPTVDFQSLSVNEILNTPQVVFNDLMETASDLVNQIKENSQDVLSVAKSAIKDATRFTQDIYGAFADLAKFPQTVVAGIIDDMFPYSSAPVKNLLKNMTAVCRNKALGKAFFNQKLPNPKCKGMHIGSPKCAPETAANLINQATLGALGQIQKSLNNLLSQIVGLGNLGFGANLCGVFAAITQGLTDKSVLTMAAGMLLNQQGSMGNIQAVFDISKSLGNLPIVGTFPGTISNIASNLTVPFGNFQNDLLGMGEQVSGAFEAIDTGWDMSEDGMMSVASLGDYNDELGDMFYASGSDLSLDMDSLDEIQAPDRTELASAYGGYERINASSSNKFVGSASYDAPSGRVYESPNGYLTLAESVVANHPNGF